MRNPDQPALQQGTQTIPRYQLLLTLKNLSSILHVLIKSVNLTPPVLRDYKDKTLIYDDRRRNDK
ncbi:hypothetical protein BpHYR1_038315 [Brachionus plicatilis]|uniref:Uncharacterized protein n=1 Tax=Brachionus plicatilis TaxID=10195 RepID=A0A3M7RYI3_BRAPC|nr:hypothetical protein BpHYR1_038315 [Brachionus plicatilis]